MHGTFVRFSRYSVVEAPCARLRTRAVRRARTQPAGSRSAEAPSQGGASPFQLPALSWSSVAVVLGLVRPVRRHADVRRLLRAQLGELRPQRREVEPRNLLVEVLGEHVDLLLVLVVAREQLDLGDRLVGEGV